MTPCFHFHLRLPAITCFLIPPLIIESREVSEARSLPLLARCSSFRERDAFGQPPYTLRLFTALAGAAYRSTAPFCLGRVAFGGNLSSERQ